MTDRQFRDQLDAARYAMERVRFTHLATLVHLGLLPISKVDEEMRAAMDNYDGIIESAASGSFGDVHAKERQKVHDYRAECAAAVEQMKAAANV